MPTRQVAYLRTLRHILLLVLAGLLAAALFVACEALPTDPGLESDRSIAGAERFDGRASASALPAGLQVTSGTTSFMCVLSTRTDAASAGAMGPAYTYRYVGLAFDAAFVESAAGSVMTLTYRLRDERGHTTRQATCRLPENLQAQALLSAWLFPQSAISQGQHLQFVRENMPGLFTTWDDLLGEPCDACYGGNDCVWTSCDDLPDGEFCYTGGICYPVDGGDDEEEVEPIDIPGGGGHCDNPWDCPDMPDEEEDPPPGGGGGTPPSDDCPDDEDDTPAPPEGGDEPCGLDCWDPPEDDDPFNPPGFMSVQSWQTTSSGMAVAVYQPNSADCPGDDDPPPCSEKDFGDEELQAIMESLDEQSILQEMMDDSDADNDEQMERKEQGGWVVQESDGSFSLIRYHDVDGADIEYTPTGIRGVKYSQMPENAVATIHTHPFKKDEALTAIELVEEHAEEELLEEFTAEVIADRYVTPVLRAVAEPSDNDLFQAGRLPNLNHIILGRDHVVTYDAELGEDEDSEEIIIDQNFDNHDSCGVTEVSN